MGTINPKVNLGHLINQLIRRHTALSFITAKEEEEIQRVSCCPSYFYFPIIPVIEHLIHSCLESYRTTPYTTSCFSSSCNKPDLSFMRIINHT